MLLWSGQTVSAVGSQLSGFVLPLLVLSLTGSAAQAGFVGAVEGVPYIILGLPAGVLVDRWNRKVLMIVCDTLRALNLLSLPVAAAIGRLSVPQLYAVALIEATHPDWSEIEHVRRYVRAGASPRGLQALVTCAQVRALMEVRYNVAVEDIQALARPALRHRVLLNFDGQAEGLKSEAIIDRVLEAVPVQ